MITYSDSYKKELVNKHKAGIWGVADAISRMDYITKHLLKLEAHTILDYGCGKGSFKKYMSQNLPNYSVSEYDPGIEGKDIPPKPADYVVCWDVMEHIEPEYVDSVITHMQGLMLKGGYVYICLLPAQSLLCDGRNAHLTVQSSDWWLDKFNKAFNKVENAFQSRGHLGLAITR